MTKVIETNADGSLTPLQTEVFKEKSSQALKEVFVSLGELTPAEIVEILANMNQSENLLNIVNRAFQSVLDADVPNAYNQAMIYNAMGIVQAVFEQIAAKVTANEKKVLETELGMKYEDISPKDVVEYLSKQVEFGV